MSITVKQNTVDSIIYNALIGVKKLVGGVGPLGGSLLSAGAKVVQTARQGINAYGYVQNQDVVHSLPALSAALP